MGLRALVTRRAGWTEHRSWSLDGTHLELRPESIHGFWLVVDRRDDIRVSGPYERLNRAKVSAERLVEKEPERFRKEPG